MTAPTPAHRVGSPLVSIILPNLDGGRHLQAAIDSFVAQDHDNKELVVVDARSEDDSHAILDAATRRHAGVVWVREQDNGISDAFIRGLQHCRGEVIGYLGSDDRLMPGILSDVVSTLTVIDADSVFYNSYTWWVPERRCELRRPPVPEMTRAALLAHGTIVGWQNIFFRRRVYERHLPSRDARWAMDYEFYLRISEEGFLHVYRDVAATVNLFDTGNVLGGNISRDPDGRQWQESCRIAAAYDDGVTPLLFR